MKVFENFKERVMAIEIDPRVYVVENAEHRLWRLLGDLAPDLAAQIARSHLDQLLSRVEPMLKLGRYDLLDKPLADFSSGIATAVQWEREHGSLKPVTPSSELDRCKELLSAKAYHAGEFKGLLHSLADGECSRRVNFRTIETSTRTITREDIRAAYPFDRVVSEEFKERTFTPDHFIARAEKAEHDRVEAASVEPGTFAAGCFVQDGHGRIVRP
jgi:hypothetical protein